MAMAAMVATSSSVLSSPSLRYSARCSSDSSSFPSSSVDPNSVKLPLFPQQLRTEATAGNERDPALKYANVMWFRGSYNAQIFVSEDEPADSVVRRFRKAVMAAGVIPECRRRRFFETPQDIVKRKLQAAQRRNKSRRFTPRPDLFGDKKDGAASKAKNEDDDFWGYVDESS